MPLQRKKEKSKRSRPKLRYSKWLFESDHLDKSVGLRDLRTLSRQLYLSWSSPKSKWYISINFALDWIPWSPKKSVPSKWRRLLSATKNQKIQGRSITKVLLTWVNFIIGGALFNAIRSAVAVHLERKNIFEFSFWFSITYLLTYFLTIAMFAIHFKITTKASFIHRFPK